MESKGVDKMFNRIQILFGSALGLNVFLQLHFTSSCNCNIIRILITYVFRWTLLGVVGLRKNQSHLKCKLLYCLSFCLRTFIVFTFLNGNTGSCQATKRRKSSAQLRAIVCVSTIHCKEVNECWCMGN